MRETSDNPLVVVSNRGPISFAWERGRLQSHPSGGGLASRLTPLAREDGFTWMCTAAEPAAAVGCRASLDATAATASGQVRVIPIPLPEPVFEDYYYGISNEILWMLQHGLIGAGGFEGTDSAHQRAWDFGYLAANRRIADAVTRSCTSARAFLVQDYHLYPLPALLRRANPGVPILHFTHIPFPGPAVWRLLPGRWPTAILTGMLGADVVGLQTARDVQAFLDCCQSILGVQVEINSMDGTSSGTVVTATGRRVLVRAFPASVDPQSLAAEVRSDGVRVARKRLAAYAGYRLIVRADRLDPAKNQLAGFQAFGRLLEARPNLRGRARFLAILSPSRTELRAYRAYRAAVLQAVDAINDRLADACGGPPIALCLEHDRALALAALERCDVLLANSLADGMNLVPKEWALVTRDTGMAVISETAGVAAEASDAALLVSPRDIVGTALALGEALDMPTEERARRLARFRARVTGWTSRDWLYAQLTDLDHCSERLPVGMGSGWDGTTMSLPVPISELNDNSCAEPRCPSRRPRCDTQVAVRWAGD
jgi:trehalose 6-phosphate synthase